MDMLTNKEAVLLADTHKKLLGMAADIMACADSVESRLKDACPHAHIACERSYFASPHDEQPTLLVRCAVCGMTWTGLRDHEETVTHAVKRIGGRK